MAGRVRGRDADLAERGQSTVEYALVLFAFLSCVGAMGVMWHAARNGPLVQRSVECSSHALSGADVLGSAQDIALY